MRVQIYDTYEEMSKAAADLVAAQILQKPNCHLGLTAGQTPVGMCAELVNLYKDHRVSLRSVHFTIWRRWPMFRRRIRII